MYCTVNIKIVVIVSLRPQLDAGEARRKMFLLISRLFLCVTLKEDGVENGFSD